MQQPLTILYLTAGNSKIRNLQNTSNTDSYFDFIKNHGIEIIAEDGWSCKFSWDSDIGFIPWSWSCVPSVSSNIIPCNIFSKFCGGTIRPCTWEELLEFMGDTRTIKITVQNEIPTQEILKLFDTCEFLSYINYPKTITALETLKVVETKQSLSFMVSDSRQFSIIGEEEWYDVDILGTTLGREITAKITELYRIS